MVLLICIEMFLGGSEVLLIWMLIVLLRNVDVGLIVLLKFRMIGFFGCVLVWKFLFGD